MGCISTADLLVDAILDAMELWYQQKKTRGQLGYSDAVFNYVVSVPGLESTKRDKVKNAMSYMITKYKDDQLALGTSGNDGELEYFRKKRKRKVAE